MAITTSPDNIPSPTSGDPYNYVVDMAALADGTQDALTQKANMGVGTSTQRTAALSKFPDGALWYDTTTSSEWRRVAGAWVNKTRPMAQAGDITTDEYIDQPNWAVVKTVTFAVAFSGTPAVSLQNQRSYSGVLHYQVISVTSAGFQIGMRSDSSKSVQDLFWIAVQKTQ